MGKIAEKILSVFTCVLNKTILCDIEDQKKRAQDDFCRLVDTPENRKNSDRVAEFQIRRLIENTFSTEKCNRLLALMTFVILLLTFVLLFK
ncbi:MAG: hypothetical protein WC484_06975 [Candidatus Omnitrophota bacterium]